MTAHFGFGKEKTHFLHTVSDIPNVQRNPSMPLDSKGLMQTIWPVDGAEFTFYLLHKHTGSFLANLKKQWRLLGMEGKRQGKKYSRSSYNTRIALVYKFLLD